MSAVPPGAFADFRSAAAAVLAHLHARVGFDLWMITRVEGDDWIILRAEDHGYGVKEGTVFRWADTFCSAMIRGDGPQIAPRSDASVAYASAAIGKDLKIGAYIGFPLTREDGTLFGTLCAIHPASQPEQILNERPLIELLSRLLGGLLNAELRDVARAREDERAALREQEMEDPATGLFDARGWRRLVELEERACARFGAPAFVAVVRVRQARTVGEWGGPPPVHELMRRAAKAIADVTRGSDVVARVGRYDLAVLSPECGRDGARGLIGRIRTGLAVAEIDASVGSAHRTHRDGIVGAFRVAEELAAEPDGDRSPDLR